MTICLICVLQNRSPDEDSPDNSEELENMPPNKRYVSGYVSSSQERDLYSEVRPYLKPYSQENLSSARSTSKHYYDFMVFFNNKALELVRKGITKGSVIQSLIYQEWQRQGKQKSLILLGKNLSENTNLPDNWDREYIQVADEYTAELSRLDAAIKKLQDEERSKLKMKVMSTSERKLIKELISVKEEKRNDVQDEAIKHLTTWAHTVNNHMKKGGKKAKPGPKYGSKNKQRTSKNQRKNMAVSVEKLQRIASDLKNSKSEWTPPSRVNTSMGSPDTTPQKRTNDGNTQRRHPLTGSPRKKKKKRSIISGGQRKLTNFFSPCVSQDSSLTDSDDDLSMVNRAHASHPGKRRRHDSLNHSSSDGSSPTISSKGKKPRKRIQISSDSEGEMASPSSRLAEELPLSPGRVSPTPNDAVSSAGPSIPTFTSPRVSSAVLQGNVFSATSDPLYASSSSSSAQPVESRNADSPSNTAGDLASEVQNLSGEWTPPLRVNTPTEANLSRQSSPQLLVDSSGGSASKDNKTVQTAPFDESRNADSSSNTPEAQELPPGSVSNTDGFQVIKIGISQFKPGAVGSSACMGVCLFTINDLFTGAILLPVTQEEFDFYETMIKDQYKMRVDEAVELWEDNNLNCINMDTALNLPMFHFIKKELNSTELFWMTSSLFHVDNWFTEPALAISAAVDKMIEHDIAAAIIMVGDKASCLLKDGKIWVLLDSHLHFPNDKMDTDEAKIRPDCLGRMALCTFDYILDMVNYIVGDFMEGMRVNKIHGSVTILTLGSKEKPTKSKETESTKNPTGQMGPSNQLDESTSSGNTAADLAPQVKSSSRVNTPKEANLSAKSSPQLLVNSPGGSASKDDTTVQTARSDEGMNADSSSNTAADLASQVQSSLGEWTPPSRVNTPKANLSAKSSPQLLVNSPGGSTTKDDTTVQTAPSDEGMNADSSSDTAVDLASQVQSSSGVNTPKEANLSAKSSPQLLVNSPGGSTTKDDTTVQTAPSDEGMNADSSSDTAVDLASQVQSSSGVNTPKEANLSAKSSPQLLVNSPGGSAGKDNTTVQAPPDENRNSGTDGPCVVEILIEPQLQQQLCQNQIPGTPVDSISQSSNDDSQPLTESGFYEEGPEEVFLSEMDE